MKFQLSSGKQKVFIVFALICWLMIVTHPVFGIERRREQFREDFGYQLIPFPYSLPGLGQGWGIWLAVNNMFETYTDLYGYNIYGDAEGFGYGIDQLEIVPDTLMINLGQETITLATIMQYEKRGMDTEKEDFKYLEGKDIKGNYGTATLTFMDRMLDFYWSFYTQEYKLTAIRDNEGELIQEIENPDVTKYGGTTAGILLDYTDDRQDPRKGVRLDIYQSHTPRQKESDPDYYVRDYNLSFYIPVGKISTLALNYFRSDAHVTSKGETDTAKIRQDLGLNCGVNPECIEAENQLVANQLAANLNGTSTSLGGRDRLRAYPDSRFIGAHTLFYAAEFRWNLTEEYTPFDVYLIRDIRTGVQLALFWEEGSVSEELSDLGKEKRNNWGAGVRIVTGSGIVFRIDSAQGDEGSALTMIIDYPWGDGF